MWQEDRIRGYFQAWINKDASALKPVISPEITCTGADGCCYLGMGQVLRHFSEWNRQGTVMEWEVKRFTHQEEYTLAEWYYREDVNHVETSLEGVSLFTFDDLQKILTIREFHSEAERHFPFGQDPLQEPEGNSAVTSTAQFSEVKVVQYNGGIGQIRPLQRQQDLEAAGLGMGRFEQRMYHAKKAGTFYGIRFQNEPRAQNKLIYCFRGRGLDYAVDLRKNSPTYLKSTCVEISAENGRQIWIPKGFGHAFLALEDNTCMVCCFDEPFDERYSRTLRWDDPELKLQLPMEPLVGEADAAAPLLAECDLKL